MEYIEIGLKSAALGMIIAGVPVIISLLMDIADYLEVIAAASN